jgi:hypothetical protein
MKKNIFNIVLIMTLFVIKGYGQTIQASIGSGATSSSVRIYLKPDITNAAVAISTLQFNVAIPSSVTPAPTLTVTTNNIAGTTWIVDASYVEGGYRHYNIYNNQSLYTLNCTANTEFQAMEVTFAGGPAGSLANTAHLVTLPDGGANSAIFYCTSAVPGVLNSNGSNLYYARDVFVTVANGFSYFYNPADLDPNKPAGTFTSYARLISAVVLPISLTKYDATCSDKGANITWTTANEINTSHFEIERSENGTDFRSIGRVAAAGVSTTDRNYQYLDLEGGAAYYRVRLVDKDGKNTSTGVKRTNCGTKATTDMVLYPTPATTMLTLAVKSTKQIKTNLIVYDAAGKLVLTQAATLAIGSNNVYLNVQKLAAGEYLLVSSDPSFVVNKKFTVAR